MRVIVGTRNTSRWPAFAGSTWVRLQYMLGLLKLGVDAYWVDHLRPVKVYKHPHSLEDLVRRFDQTAREFGFGDRYCIVYKGGEQFFGMSGSRLRGIVEDTDLLLSISGALVEGSPLSSICRRAYIDVDPGFTQIWALSKELGLQKHNFFFTVGQNIGGPGFDVPISEIDWQPTLPPVVLSEWPANIDSSMRRFSTVADWRGSQIAFYRGESYRGKRPEFRRIIELPHRAKIYLDRRHRFEPAICIGKFDHEDVGALTSNGWYLRDPYVYAGDPYSYREFIRYSRAEVSVAKHGYVRSRSGWVSDRTACYLASGKPALVQSTGFESRLPVGQGLLTFRCLDEAVDGIRDINGEYEEHCRAARRIAEVHFDSDRVLGSLINRVGL